MPEPPPRSELFALMFTDLVGSVALKVKLGDADYVEWIAKPHNDIFREILSRFPGAVENNYTGDGFLATFGRVSDAVNAALLFHHGLRTHEWQRDAPQARVAIHVGEVTVFEGSRGGPQSMSSLSADLCARLMGLGSGGQTLLTQAAFDNARQYVREHPAVGDGPAPELKWLAHGRYLFQAKDEPLEVFEVGAVGWAPLLAPEDSPKAKRAVSDEERQTLGWRPGVGLEIPGRAEWMVERKLGEGGFGEVWLAKHARSKLRRVFKFCFDPDRLRSFKRELTTFRLIREALGERADIVPLRDLRLDAPPFFLECDFIEAGDLAHWAGQKGGIDKLPAQVRLQVLERIARAVAAAHSVGIIHKDIHPSNILIRELPDGTVQPVLADFGIGAIADRALLEKHNITITGFTESVLPGNEYSRTGTRLYAPPESLVGKPATIQGDIYSLGVMLYQLVVGDLNRPLATGWQDDIADELLRQDITACVHGDPSRRLANAGELADRLQRLEQRRAHEPAAKSLDPGLTVKSATPPPVAPLLTEKAGDRIGRYKLLQEIGEGGCGVVYMAEQEQPVRRRVALKVIKLGMDTKHVIARFDAERQALALMDHPNIARVLDAGATETGRPFFVMELVRGIKITDFCDEKKLSTEDRLKLFIQVCRAIQHAHQKGIIHRDIKPSNILVSINDGASVPKVIDFGIAKATEGRLTDQTLFTAFEQFIGTPVYMSPEQAVMSGLDIDTRSDIYSLGVLLYELLTGKTPFDPKELVSAGLEGMRKAIREDEPLRPSTKLNTLQGEDLTTTAKRRGSDAPRLVSLMRGDLDWIVMKCLEKDRARRYETANGLAMDVERHLNNEPVVARPPSKLYRFQKMVRRNKLAVAAAGAIAMALLLGAVVSFWQAVRASHAEVTARRERDAATRARQQAEAINRFLTEDLLYQATPDENAREKKVTMEEVLERASRKLDQSTDIASQPELEATLRLAVGSTYSKLGVLGEAERHLRRAVALRRSALGPPHQDTLAAQNELARFLGRGARKFEEGEALSLETWQGRQRLLGAENRDTLDTMSIYVMALADQKKLEEAARLARQCFQTYERVFGPDDSDTINSLGNLAYVLATRGDFAEAERYEREEVQRFQRTGLADKEEALYAVNNLAMFRLMQGDLGEAEKLLAEARPRAARIFGPEHLVTLHVQHCLALVLTVAGRLDEAEALARETLEVRRRVTPGHEGTGRTLLILGRVLVEKGRLDEAEPLLREALALFRERYAMKPELAAQVANWLGTIQLARHAYPEAEALLLPSAEPILAPTAAMPATEQRTAVGHIVTLYQAWGKPEQAALWQQKLDELAKPQTSARTR